MPEAIPLDVNRSARIAVRGLAYRVHKADIEHANGETEKGEKDNFITRSRILTFQRMV